MSEREPITAELREALDVDREFMRADGMVVAQTFCVDRDDFERLCDAIDAVHAALERENAELRQRVAVLDNDNGNMHDGWVRLPLDADGVPIHVGDVMEGTCPSGKHVNGTVNAIGDGVFWISNVQFSLKPNYMHHYHAPTVEDVLTKFGIDWEYEDNCEDRAALLAEYAAKLRLAGDAE